MLSIPITPRFACSSHTVLDSNANEGTISGLTEVWLAVVFAILTAVTTANANGIPLFEVCSFIGCEDLHSTRFRPIMCPLKRSSSSTRSALRSTLRMYMGPYSQL